MAAVVEWLQGPAAQGSGHTANVSAHQAPGTPCIPQLCATEVWRVGGGSGLGAEGGS